MAKQTKLKAVKTVAVAAAKAAPVVVMEETATERIARKRAAAAAKAEPVAVQAAAAKAEPVKAGMTFTVGKPLMTHAEAVALMNKPAPAFDTKLAGLMPKAARRAAKAAAAKAATASKPAPAGKPAAKPATAHTAAKPATKAAPVPCSKCGRQNPQNADCRVASACARRVKAGKKAAPAAAAEARA